jgi:hypothetical protein
MTALPSAATRPPVFIALQANNDTKIGRAHV